MRSFSEVVDEIIDILPQEEMELAEQLTGLKLLCEQESDFIMQPYWFRQCSRILTHWIEDTDNQELKAAINKLYFGTEG